jgi:Ni/Co efflux regulator RcnB
LKRPWPGRDRLGLDRLGLTQTIGGLILGLIALFSSYDHITIAGRSLPIQQQWGIPFIAASVATVFVDAQLATGSRLRAAHERDRDRDLAREAKETAYREADRANRRENEADRERNRAAEERERQRKSFERLDQAALLSARVQLEPTEINRARLRTFLSLMGQPPLGDGDGV